MNPNLPSDPDHPRPEDLCRVVVLGVPPWPALGLTPEATFSPRPERHVFGAYRTREGRRVVVAVDPAMDPMEFVIEDALTGAVVRAGRVGERLPKRP